MSTLIEKNASFYKLCSILTPMEKIAEEPREDLYESGDKGKDSGAIVNDIAKNTKSVPEPNVVRPNPPSPEVTVTKPAMLS